jgi:class 3 adenylate cyclase
MPSIDHSPRTVVFMSVDIADSTRFKELYGVDGDPRWLEAFEAFFKEFPLVLMGQIASAFAETDDLTDVSVWKVIGDEIVFRAQPRSAEEALRVVEAFYRTVVAYDARFFERWPLRIRGCCWAARLPGRNIEIEIPEMNGVGQVDYLGPDIDLGFRLASQAERGQVILSLNLAEAFAGLPDRRGLRFHYIDRKVLKGVFAGRPYPLILVTWKDCLPELWQWEEEDSQQLSAIRDTAPIDPEALIELAGNIQRYLNRMCRLNIVPLEF